MSQFVKIRLVGAALFHVTAQTQRSFFCSFVVVPRKGCEVVNIYI